MVALNYSKVITPMQSLPGGYYLTSSRQKHLMFCAQLRGLWCVANEYQWSDPEKTKAKSKLVDRREEKFQSVGYKLGGPGKGTLADYTVH